MKLYKFRPLGNNLDFRRLKEIIEEKKFWCPKLWDLNDPMEGVYRNSFFPKDRSNDIFTEKNRYHICSFSGKDALENPKLWGYYANGYRGVAIEIEVPDDDKNIYGITYQTLEKFNENLDNAIKIITRKLSDWEHEDEYRFLSKSEIKKCEIGEITKIYFGNPYYNLVNTKQIYDNSDSLKKYRRDKDKMKKICDKNKITWEEFYSNKD